MPRKTRLIPLAILGLGLATLLTAADKPKAKVTEKQPPTTVNKVEDEKKDDTAGPKVDFSGDWSWSFTSPNGTMYEPTLKIQQRGSKLAGRIYGKRGGNLPVRDVRMTKDSKVAFTLDREFYGFPMVVQFLGKLEGDTIVGKMKVQANGNERIFDWTAKRVKGQGTTANPTDSTAKQAPKL